MKQRIAFIDLAKGICISLVVLWHVLREQSDGYDFFQILFFFRMPLYFVLSGIFFKTYEGFYSFLKKKTNKLLIPFLFAYFVFGIPSILFQDRWNGDSTTLYSFFEEYGRLDLGLVPSAWFLICLLFVNLYFYSVFVVSKRNIKVISLSCIVLGILGYYINVLGFYISLWLDTSLTVMPFFLFGYLMRNFSNILYSEMKQKYYLLFVFSLTALLLTYYIFEHRNLSSLNFIQNIFGINIISLYLGGISGSICILIIAKYLQYVPVFSYIGRYSIVVLLTHQPLLFIIRNIYYQLGLSQEGFLNNFVIFIIIIFLSLPIISFCVKYLPYCFAQKDVWK